MLTLILPDEISSLIIEALLKSGSREVGGILMAEHTGVNEFTIRDITVQKRGAFASFFRKIEDALGRLNNFFDKAYHDYSRFNYLGEWHSHPSFEPIPSPKDDQSMFQIVQDVSVGANFAVLLIVKLNATSTMIGTAHTYFPDGNKARALTPTIRST
ncbi:MAG: Mov34/MPN/PAD-1 family protein [Burkholderiales bacterium]|nr:Mov34/MPN/PAD-1 family protein [Burkholderiales bacterium]